MGNRATQNDTGFKSFIAGEALAACRRVKLDTTVGQVVYADASDDFIGVTQEAAAISTAVRVKLKGGPGTLVIETAGAVVLGSMLYGQDDGKVDDVASSFGTAVGRACQVAAATATYVEVQPLVDIPQGWGYAKTGAATDTATLTAAQVLSGILNGVPTAAAAYTTPTATEILAAIPDAFVGMTFDLVVNNNSGGANTITMTGGTGVTVDGTATVAQNVSRLFRCRVDNVGTPGITMYGC
jgi:hypothetical protein